MYGPYSLLLTAQVIIDDAAIFGKEGTAFFPGKDGVQTLRMFEPQSRTVCCAVWEPKPSTLLPRAWHLTDCYTLRMMIIIILQGAA